MIRLLLFVVLIASLHAEAIAQSVSPVMCDKISWKENPNGMLKSTFVESQSYAKTDFIYQCMEWDIDPNVRYISGKITTYFKSKINDLSVIEFDLNDVMFIDSICQNKTKLTFTRNSGKVAVSLGSVLQETQTDSISISYHGVPVESGYGSFTQSKHGDANTPIIWTLSEPYGAMEWWPCKQSLSDKIDSVDIIVTSPKAYRTASNGILVSETISNEKRTMHWKHRFPIATYLVAIAVTNYESYSDYVDLENGDSIEILNYVYPENLEKAKTETPVTTELIKLYNQLVGIYPFANEKYGHAQFGWGGGMEHQTMSFMGGFSFGLIAHELAHQWFGDCITLGSWQDIWLNEGFATYLTGLAHENLLEEGDWSFWKNAYKKQVLSKNDGSVFVNDTTSISRIFNSRLSYAKGGFLLHMQRWILGDEVFFQALKSYFADEKISNGFALSEDWIRHIETAGDTSLTQFFNDWLYGEGYPVYSINYIQQKSDSLTIVLSQTTSHSSVNFFEMPVPIRVYGTNKTDSANFRLNNTHNHQNFILNPGFMIEKIVIDPDNWILCKSDEITHIQSIAENNKMMVYPNPTSHNISINLQGNESIVCTSIYTILGKIVKQVKTNQSEINISDLPAGIYLMQIETSNSCFKKKIIKQ